MDPVQGGNLKFLKKGTENGFVLVRKRDLDKLTTEVMQLREFLPKVLNRGFGEILHETQATRSTMEHVTKEQEYLRQECLHLQSRLEAVQVECQKEREEKLLLRDRLWQSASDLQRQADFCADLGSAACSLLWSCSTKEDTVTHWLVDGKLQALLVVASQTLQSFIGFMDEERHSEELQGYQFVQALTGTVSNIAAVSCGREFLSTTAQFVPDTIIKLLERMKPGVCPKIKVLMLSTLYNVSISVKGQKYISQNPALLSVIWKLLDDGDWTVCLQSLRLLQSLMLDEEQLISEDSIWLDPELKLCLQRLCSSPKPSLREAAVQALKDLQVLLQGWRSEQIGT
ncbi:heat shock factor 2-binding protein isoform X2 [Synchiropus splendidus]|uniref:heat shock factor 2-binding protein isoform X2 n=1 Tax=Synchiropus splendidus TaxID=270530 RepID=UPI00237E3C44|nr:heat shock factor 2-binding protein isoform X2 [Synchiropus splendidus]